MAGGRLHGPELVATLHEGDGEAANAPSGNSDTTEATRILRSPAVGTWRDPPDVGAAIAAGAAIGALEVLGAVHLVRAPAGGSGVVVRVGDGRSHAGRSAQPRGHEPVGFGDVLLVLDPRGLASAGASGEAAARIRAAASDGAAFCAPTSGRYYGRPAPDKPAFVAVGDILETGRTVCMLEVMKTFNRVTYSPGASLPERARVVAILPRDDDDLAAGAPILTVEPA